MGTDRPRTEPRTVAPHAGAETEGGERVEDESLEYLYTMYYATMNAVMQATWALAYPPPLPSEEPEELKKARDMAHLYEQKIQRRLQEIKDRVTMPVGVTRPAPAR